MDDRVSNRPKKPPVPACARCVVRHGLHGAGISGDVVQASCEQLTLNVARRRQLLFLEGNQASCFYVLRAGHVKLTRLDANGQERIVGLLSPGDLFGLAALFEGVHTSTAEVLTDAVLCVGARESVDSLMNDTPGFGRGLAHYIYQQLEDARARLAWLGTVGSRARLAAYLLHHVGPDAGPTPTIPHLLTQSELGAILGMSGETVCRVLAGLRKKGLIRVNGDRIDILDLPSLKKAAGL